MTATRTVARTTPAVAKAERVRKDVAKEDQGVPEGANVHGLAAWLTGRRASRWRRVDVFEGCCALLRDRLASAHTLYIADTLLSSLYP